MLPYSGIVPETCVPPYVTSAPLQSSALTRFTPSASVYLGEGEGEGEGAGAGEGAGGERGGEIASERERERERHTYIHTYIHIEIDR